MNLYKNVSNKSTILNFYTSKGISRHPLDETIKEFKIAEEAKNFIDLKITSDGMNFECEILAAAISERANINEIDEKIIFNSLKYIRRSLLVFGNKTIPVLLNNNIFHIAINLLFHQNVHIAKCAAYTLYEMTLKAPNCMTTLFSLNIISAIYQVFNNFMLFVDFVKKNKVVESKRGSMVEDENVVVDISDKVFTVVRFLFIYYYLYKQFKNKSPDAFAPFSVKYFNDIFQSTIYVLSKSHISTISIYRDIVLQQRQQNYIKNQLHAISLIYCEMCKKTVSADDLEIIIDFLLYIISSNYTDSYAYVMEILINLVESNQITLECFMDPNNNFYNFMKDEVFGAETQSKCRALDLFVYLLNQGMPFNVNKPEEFIDLILSTIDSNNDSEEKCEASAAGLRLIAAIIRCSNDGWIINFLMQGNKNNFGFMTLIEMCSGQLFCVMHAAAYCLIELLNKTGISGITEINFTIFKYRGNEFFEDPKKRNRSLVKALISCAQLEDDEIVIMALKMLISMNQAAQTTGLYEELKCDYYVHDGFDNLEEIKEQHGNDEIIKLANIVEKEYSPAISE